MQLHQLKRHHGQRDKKRVARGGKRGKTAGRGTKGQKSRAGHRMRPELRDIIKKVPKNRGYKFKSIQSKFLPVNIAALEIAYAAGETVSPETLVAKKLVSKTVGKFAKVKILATGTLTKKLTVTGCVTSATAKAAIEKAGGTVSA